MSETPGPYLTIRFFTDGHSETVVGPDRFPTDPDGIQKCAGSVLIMLYQIGNMAFRRFLSLQIQDMKLEHLLAQMDEKGIPH